MSISFFAFILLALLIGHHEQQVDCIIWYWPLMEIFFAVVCIQYKKLICYVI